ncbi:MAG: hypothetical protein EOP43_02230 [Sphingobacteriaceae bacterium]|nr:MAG: hypothetical protein EOP43_02230 [Sphingobacteriaceae bacterium]
MNALVYLLQVSACTAIFYLFYRLLLSRLTFFTINRWYLLTTVLLSFIIPVLTIPINPQQQHITVVQQAVYINTLQTASVNIADKQSNVPVAKPVDWLQMLKFFYVLIVIGLLIRLIITLILFFKRLKGKQLTKVNHVNILRGETKLNNGSFFNYIFLNDQELSADEMQQIIAHEMLHVKLNHSIDRLLIKITQIILWFNPFVYLYAKSIEENHEFEVDSAMTNFNDKKQYADLLLHLSVAGQGLLYHSFSKIPLKKRITMLFNKPSAKMKKVIYVLILPVVLICCLYFARLESNSAEKKYSVIDGIEKLGKSPLVLIDGKVYEKEILYKIGNSCIKSTGVWAPSSTIKKHGVIIKDGFVEITTGNSKINYMTALEKENLIQEKNVPKDQFYTRLRINNLERGGFIDKIIVQIQESNGIRITKTVSTNGKALFEIDDKPYTEEQIKKLPRSLVTSLVFSGVWPGVKQTFPASTFAGYEAVFSFSSNADTATKYRQKLKRSPEQIKGEANFKAYRQTDDFKQKEKFARDIRGKTITVKIKDTVNRDARKMSDMFVSHNGKVRGFTVVYKGNEYFMPTKYDQEKQLNNVLKTGDEITLEVLRSTFAPNYAVTIEPAFIYKDNIKIFQLAQESSIPDYPFLYEANKVRFADGQITHIQKYPNGKWKSAVMEIANGYKFNLNFKATAPDFANIEESDHVRFRFVHEVKTGAKTYQINDWVSISNNIKDYGIKNPDFFYKFYEVAKLENQQTELEFKVTKLSYQTPQNMLATLKKNQPNSYVSVGKTINTNTLKSEQERVYRFLSAQFPQVEKKNIVFNVDTTAQKGKCTIVTVVKLNS